MVGGGGLEVEGYIPLIGLEGCDASNDWITGLWCIDGIGLCDLNEFVGACDGSCSGGYEVLVLLDGLHMLIVVVVIIVTVVVGIRGCENGGLLLSIVVLLDVFKVCSMATKE